MSIHGKSFHSLIIQVEYKKCFTYEDKILSSYYNVIVWLIGPFVSYEENEVSWKLFTTLNSLKCTNRLNKLESLSLASPSSLVKCNTLAYKTICKLQQKRSVVNTDSGAVLTTLYFICNLRMGPIR